MFNFKENRLNLNKILGEGSSGKVYPYQENPNHEKWVVKRIEIDNIEDLLKSLPEIVIGFSCNHPCIVPVKGYFIERDGNKYYLDIKLPRMKKENLFDEFVKRRAKKEFYKEEDLIKCFYALVCGVSYLHTERIFHGDIKMNNVLFDYSGNIKLSDVGCSRYIPDEDLLSLATKAYGAQDYKAPEIIEHENQLKDWNYQSEQEKKENPRKDGLKKESFFLADSWSLGVVMLELCVLELKPVIPYLSEERMRMRLNGVRKIAQEKGYKKAFLDLIFGLLSINPKERLKVKDVKIRLESEFPGILNKEFKAHLGIEDDKKIEVSESHIQMFKAGLKDISRRFEGFYHRKLDVLEERIRSLQEKLHIGFKLAMRSLEMRNNKKIEEVTKSYEEFIKSLKQENIRLLERHQIEKKELTQS